MFQIYEQIEYLPGYLQWIIYLQTEHRVKAEYYIGTKKRPIC